MDILEKLKALLGKVEDLQDELVDLIDELEELELDEDDLDELDDEDEEDDIKIGLSEQQQVPRNRDFFSTLSCRGQKNAGRTISYMELVVDKSTTL